jgi:pimeloyl-ACP methyl ester carboxylesterase
MVLVSGSGPQDRDETLMGHKPFWVLADYLARRGIATLRYDDRGVGRSTGDFANATTADFADDAYAAIKYLKSSGLIAPSRIGLIGHSEGGLVVAMLGAKREEGLLTCGVMLAGPSVSGTEIHQSQIRDMMEASTFPLPDSTISKVLGLSSEIYPANYLPGTWEERKRLGFELYEKAYERFNILEKVLLGIDGQSNQLAEAIVNPWFSFFLKYDPRTDLSLQQKPILALYASLDKQVSSKQNIASLQTINNDYIEVQIFSGLNHMFQHAETGLPDEYAIIEETMAPKVLETISAWTLGNC